MDYTLDVHLITNTIRMRVSHKEMHLRQTDSGEEVKIIPFMGLSLTDLENLIEYFFTTGVLISNPKSDSPAPFYFQIAIKESDFTKITQITEKYPILEKYLGHLLFIVGYSANSALGVSKKTEASKNKEKNFNPELKQYTNYDHLLKLKEDLEGILQLFKLLNQTFPNPKHIPAWEGDKPECFPEYTIDRVFVKLKNTKNEEVSFNFTAPEITKEDETKRKVHLNFFEDIFNGFESWLEGQEKTVEDWYTERYGFLLPPKNRPDKLHSLFCKQFFRYFNEQTEFNTGNGYSQNDLLKVFVEVYKTSGYEITPTKNPKEVDTVRHWL